MTCNSLIISISIGIIALAFLILVIFSIITLLSLRRTIVGLDEKIHSFDPLFRAVSKTGNSIERKACRIRHLFNEVDEPAIEEEQVRKERILNTALEVAEWTLVGVTLWQKIRERK